MEKHPEKVEEGIVRRDGRVTPFNAGDAIAATSEVFSAKGIPLAPSVRARLGKASKALIEAGFAPDVVVSACVVCVRTGWYGSVETVAQEIAVAKAGHRISRQQFREALEETTAMITTSDSAVWQAMREDARRRAERTTP